MATGAVLSHADKLADARSVELPYVGIAIVLLLLAVAIAKLKLPDIGAATARVAAQERKKLSLWKHRNLVWGDTCDFHVPDRGDRCRQPLHQFHQKP